MTEELSRTSALASRHAALGSGLEDWNGMGTAWTYATDPDDEHDAVRERAGMFDMSPLKKIFVRGPDAQAALDHLTTRDMSKIAPGKAAYLCVLTERGGIADDAIVSNNGGGEWMIVHGSGDTMALLEASAAPRDVTLEFADDLHDLSVQGPAALDVLNDHCDIDLGTLAYFEHAPATIFDNACRVSRTGYSGERGHEIFADGSVVTDIWDELADSGVMPCSFAALDKVRIEAGLLFYGYDMTEDNTPWEVGLGFAVSRTKGDFRGKEALMAAEGSEKVNNVCLDIDHADMAAGGETLSLDGEPVGVINSPCYSRRLGKSLALAHVRPGIGAGTALIVSGDGIDAAATIVASPIYDSRKLRSARSGLRSPRRLRVARPEAPSRAQKDRSRGTLTPPTTADFTAGSIRSGAEAASRAGRARLRPHQGSAGTARNPPPRPAFPADRHPPKSLSNAPRRPEIQAASPSRPSLPPIP